MCPFRGAGRSWKMTKVQVRKVISGCVGCPKTQNWNLYWSRERHHSEHLKNSWVQKGHQGKNDEVFLMLSSGYNQFTLFKQNKCWLDLLQSLHWKHEPSKEKHRPVRPSQRQTTNTQHVHLANQKLGRPLAAVVAKCCVRSKAQRISSQLSTSSWSFWEVTNWEPPKKSSTSPSGCIVEGAMRSLFFTSFTLNILKI